MQLEVAKDNIKLAKVAGDVNPADVLTKYKGSKEISKLLDRMNIAVM